MVVKCAWCGVGVEGPDDEEQPEEVSHTICPECEVEAALTRIF